MIFSPYNAPKMSFSEGSKASIQSRSTPLMVCNILISKYNIVTPKNNNLQPYLKIVDCRQLGFEANKRNNFNYSQKKCNILSVTYNNKVQHSINSQNCCMQQLVEKNYHCDGQKTHQRLFKF